jgi:hypothetical protein
MLKSKIKKINPQKSNKMIIAVAAGLLVVVAVFFILTVRGGKSGGLPADALAYLRRTEGLIKLQILDAEKKALIVFNSDSKNAGNFERIAYYAAVRLSRYWPDCRVLLAKNRESQVVYTVQVKNGAIANEGPAVSP